jgi:hypothetical protein
MRRYTGANQVAHAASPQVMDDAALKADGPASLIPQLSEVADRLPLPVEYVGAVQAAKGPPAVDDGS